MSSSTFKSINASAGSGKTTSLVYHFLLRLFLESDDIGYRNMLALTFTNKAVNEMKKRGMNPDPSRIFPTQVFEDNNLYNNWKVTKKAVEINSERITERINQKPTWYRHTKHKRK